jgi:hypothetical protein
LTPREGLPKTVISTVSTSPFCHTDSHRRPYERPLLRYSERCRLKARCLMRVLVEPDTNRVLWLHIVALSLIRASATVFVPVRSVTIHPPTRSRLD